MSPQPGSAPPPSTRLVSVGGYRLEVSPEEDTFALFTATAEEANARTLAHALSARSEAKAAKTVDLLETPLDAASSATACSERSLSLFNSIAAGNALAPKVISEEVDAALALLDRLDRSGHHKEVLRLARDVSALLALLLRWFELVRTLRLAVANAQAIGDQSTRAWALHELGSLHLAAGQSKAAAEHLHQALELQQKLAGSGRCATRHNLDAAERDRAGNEALHKARRRRRLRFVGIGVLIALLAGGGAALGRDPPGGNPTTQAKSQSTTSPQHTTTTTIAIDTTKPTLVLTPPASFLNTATPTFSGTGGLAAGDLAAITLMVYRGLTTGGDPVDQFTAQRTPAGAFKATEPTSLTEGPYTVVATQHDRSGNVGQSPAVSFTVDLTAPIVTLTSPTNGSREPSTPTFEGTAGTRPGDTPTITINVVNEANPSAPPVMIQTRVAADGTWKITSTTSLARHQKYRAVASQTDQAGNVGSTTSPVFFYVLTG